MLLAQTFWSGDKISISIFDYFRSMYCLCLTNKILKTETEKLKFDLKDFLCVSKLFDIMRPGRHNFTFGVKFDLKIFLCQLKILDIMRLCLRPCKYRKYSMVGEGFPLASQSF